MVKRLSYTQNLGIVILLSVIFIMLGFLANLSANVVWEHSVKGNLFYEYLSVVLFFTLATLFIIWGNNLLKKKQFIH